MNIDGLHLYGQYKIDLDLYKQTRFSESNQERIIIDQIAHKLAYEIVNKKSFFSEKVVAENYIPPYKLITADCYVLTEKEFFDLVESIKKDLMQYYPIGHVDFIDNKNNG